jgi:site-specific DNA-cytosine methylase
LRSFVSAIRDEDRKFVERSSKLAASTLFKNELALVDSGVFSLAICKSFLGRLGLASLRTVSIDERSLPWAEEARFFASPQSSGGFPADEQLRERISDALSTSWDQEVGSLADASTKVGRGQHRVVSGRVASLVRFLTGPSGRALRDEWIKWRSARDCVRAQGSLAAAPDLERLYSDGRTVDLLLGGPPCKGFSRIGRAVIESLRDQGAHAWASRDYGDERNALLHKYVLFLQALRPSVFLFENVAHFASALRTPAGRLEASTLLEQIISDLSANEIHYEVRAAIVKARRHGVPQDRERYIMVGFRSPDGARFAEEFFELDEVEREVPLRVAIDGLDSPSVFTFGDGASSRTADETRAYTLLDPEMPESFKTYVSWIRQPGFDETEPPRLTDAHVVRAPRVDDLALIRKFGPGQRWMDYKLKRSDTLAKLRTLLLSLADHMEQHKCEFEASDLVAELLGKVDSGLLLRLLLEEVSVPLDGDVSTHHLLSDGYLGKGTDAHGDWFERLSAERPCKTIVAHIGKDTYGYVHPFENRAISIREAARIQTFPDFFNFGSAGIVEGYSMVGNAVPPLMANLFARRLESLSERFSVFGHSYDLEVEPVALRAGVSQIALGFEGVPVSCGEPLLDKIQEAAELVKE